MSALDLMVPSHGSWAANRAILATMLRLAGWGLVTLLTALGIITMLALVLGGFSLEGTMVQLDNLASRYVAADAERTAQFDRLLIGTFAMALFVSAFARRGSLAAILTTRSRIDV